MPGFPELIFILLILGLVFGFRGLPRLGELVGKTIYKIRHPRENRDIHISTLEDENSDKT